MQDKSHLAQWQAEKVHQYTSSSRLVSVLIKAIASAQPASQISASVRRRAAWAQFAKPFLRARTVRHNELLGSSSRG